MKTQLSLTLAVLLALPSLTKAHFVFIVPDADNKGHLLMSETLKPEEGVKVGLISKTQLLALSATGKTSDLIPLTEKDNTLAFDLPAGTRILHGTTDLGINQRGTSPAHVLIYHAKTILGNPYDAPTISPTVAKAPAELIVEGRPGATRFKLLTNGKPTPNAEITVILPDNTEEKTTTDAEGITLPYAQSGRFAAWARSWDKTPGQRDGKSFEQTRHYATLVLDVPTKAPTTQLSTNVTTITSLPIAVSSFGAVATDTHAFVYGGHISPTHTYHTDAVSGDLYSFNLASENSWKKLAPGPKVQGMNLATANGKIYRVGGMQPRNTPAAPVDNISLKEAAEYDPATNTWRNLPNLPEGRSSHDVAMINDKLYVLGGWVMNGAAEEDHWPATALVLDLKNESAGWQKFDQTFQRRALIVTVANNKIYIIGGFQENNIPSLNVDIFDPQNNTWSKGPTLPGSPRNGFSPAACTLNNTVYTSIANGSLLKLNGDTWEKVAQSTPRIVHRLLPDPTRNRILILGGAAMGDNLSLTESVSISQ